MACVARTVVLALAVIGAALLPRTLPLRAEQRAAAAPPLTASFRDVARQRGVDFVHVNGASDDKYLPEIMGSGGLFLDFDDDGWLDLFLVDGGSFADAAVARRAGHRLFRNRGDGSYEDVTAASGIRPRGYGMGACAGDIDNDELIDLYVTNVGPNLLYRNGGRGRFTEIPNAGGAAGNGWSTSCAFLDIDRDGSLDLFVTDYVDAQSGRNRFCGVSGPPPIRDYCHPLIYPPLTSALYRNTGRGTFADISAASGVGRHRGNGLGVAVSDIDDDGWPDVFVANDSMPNFLFRNRRNGTFDEIGGLAGVAVSADGKAKAGMGTAFADFTGTGRPGLIVTNHETEMHSLFVNNGGGLFSDVTLRSGLGPATRPYVGFGVAVLDYDHDTHLDIAIANGHVMANAAQLRAGAKYAQRNLLLRNAGGRFVDMKAAAGPGFAPELVSRGLAAGDIDNDGDLDLLITNNGGEANLLLNEGGSTGNAILLRLIGAKSNATEALPETKSNAAQALRETGSNAAQALRETGSNAAQALRETGSNRSAIGARLMLSVGSRRLLREVQSGSSYLAQNDLRAHFGLGEGTRADRLEIRWPGGATETVENLPANHIFTVREGKGVVARAPFTR